MGWASFLEGKSWGMHLVQLGTKYRPVSTTLSPYHIYQKQLPLDCVFAFLEVGCLIKIWKPFIHGWGGDPRQLQTVLLFPVFDRLWTMNMGQKLAVKVIQGLKTYHSLSIMHCIMISVCSAYLLFSYILMSPGT